MGATLDATGDMEGDALSPDLGRKRSQSACVDVCLRRAVFAPRRTRAGSY